MKTARFILIMILALASTSLLNAQIQQSGEAALKMTHELLINSLKSGNLATLSAVMHPRALGFYWQSQSPVQLSGEYSAMDALPSVLNDLGIFTAFTTETVYRAIGNAGIVCMSATVTSKQGNKNRPVFGSNLDYINADAATGSCFPGILPRSL